MKFDSLKEKTKKIYKYLAGLGLMAIIIAAVFSTLGEKIAEVGFNKITEPDEKVKYKEGFITPVYKNIEIDAARKYSENYGYKVLNYGCILNAEFQNQVDEQVLISKASVVIDDIKKETNPKIFLFGIYYEDDNIFDVYAVNNERVDFENGMISLTAEAYGESGSTEEFDAQDLLTLFGEAPYINIDKCYGGEIRKIFSFRMNKEYIKQKKSVLLYYSAATSNGKYSTDKTFMASFNVFNESQVYYMDSGGGDFDNVIIERSLIIDTDKDNGKELNVPANFSIEEKSWKSIQFILYPTASCQIKLHAKIKCSDEDDYSETQQFTQDIYVPLYTFEDNFHKVKNFMKELGADVYYYNTDLARQKTIDFDFHKPY